MNENSRYPGGCQACIYFDSDDNEYPCNICKHYGGNKADAPDLYIGYGEKHEDGITHDGYMWSVHYMIECCKDTLESKHTEYSEVDNDDFHNFRVAAKLQDITPEQALIGMMDKHVVSIHDMVNQTANGEELTEEKWKEKIMDNINYLLILWAMVSTKLDTKPINNNK